LSTLLDLLAREAASLLEADRASIFLLDREANELWSKVALGSDEIIRFDARLGVAGAAALSGETINVREAYHDARFYGSVDDQSGYRTRTVLAVPLVDPKGEILGTFEALNKHSGVFTAEDEHTLQTLAAHATVAIQTAQMIGALERDRTALTEQHASLVREIGQRFSTHRIIGNSHKIQGVVRLIERIRESSVNVLITGESGTGKEMVARAIHYSSPRAMRPFVALNCAALPETLVESELFGIERGVATGVEPRKGRFEMASGGTLFLDEIGDLSPSAQAKILRALQERTVERVGGRVSTPVDVRVLSAIYKDLEAEIQKGSFREDLYYRFKVIHINMPPLREIRDDIPLLVAHFLQEYCSEAGKPAMELNSGAMERLMKARWPGNTRQLGNEINRLVACVRGPLITESDLIDDEPRPPQPVASPRGDRFNLKKAVEDLEKRTVQEAMEAAKGNQQHAARLLGLSRQGLINKLKRYDIKASEGRG
jgi:Nif-specific regulatory protein